MIIFYNLQSKEITGSIGGRVHNEQQLNMWVGSQDENGRLVLEWKDDNPDELKAILQEWEQSPLKVYDYKIEVGEDDSIELIKK